MQLIALWKPSKTSSKVLLAGFCYNYDGTLIFGWIAFNNLLFSHSLRTLLKATKLENTSASFIRKYQNDNVPVRRGDIVNG